MNNRHLLSVLVDEPGSGLSSWGRSDVRSATVTADLYATATGLIERSAAAYAAGVPEGARNPVAAYISDPHPT